MRLAKIQNALISSPWARFARLGAWYMIVTAIMGTTVDVPLATDAMAGVFISEDEISVTVPTTTGQAPEMPAVLIPLFLTLMVGTAYHLRRRMLAQLAAVRF